MEKERAGRNRTITLSTEEETHYSEKCITVLEKCDLPRLENQIIRGDAFEVLERLPDSFVDLIIIDPPYNLNKTYGKSSFKKMDDNDYYTFTENWVLMTKRVLKKSASIYVCCDWNSSLIIGSVLKKHFLIQNRITWQREKGRGATHNWKNAMEDIWFATVSNDFIFNVDDVKMRRKVIAPYKVDGKPKDWVEGENGNFRDTFPSNFWDDISIPYWSMPENTDHPTQKPEKLLAKIILASSNQNDIVFDPFIGSGTTAVVAKKLGRKYLGIELEQEYCALTQKRLETATDYQEIQGYSDGVFWERNTLALQKQMSKKKQKHSQISFISEE